MLLFGLTLNMPVCGGELLNIVNFRSCARLTPPHMILVKFHCWPHVLVTAFADLQAV